MIDMAASKASEIHLLLNGRGRQMLEIWQEDEISSDFSSSVRNFNRRKLCSIFSLESVQMQLDEDDLVVSMGRCLVSRRRTKVVQTSV